MIEYYVGKQTLKQRFFMVKELRLSIAVIVIWSLLAGIVFTYITKEIGARIEHGFFSFLAVFVGYAVVVILLASFFAHRFIGPFERLKMEMKLILAGNYNRRLCIRTNDDFYIRSFIVDVNKILDRFEGHCIDKEGFRKYINAELLRMISLIEKEETSKEKMREALLSFHEKIDSLIGEDKTNKRV